jgi:hypothetical protein
MSQDIDATPGNEDAYPRSRSDGGARQSDRASLPVRQTARRAALNASLTLHPVWMWGLKPAFIGLLGVLAASPLLVVFPLVANALNVAISKTAVVVMACLVWASGTSAYLFARRPGVLDERDRLPRRKTRPKRKISLVGRMSGAEDDVEIRRCWYLRWKMGFAIRTSLSKRIRTPVKRPIRSIGNRPLRSSKPCRSSRVSIRSPMGRVGRLWARRRCRFRQYRSLQSDEQLQAAPGGFDLEPSRTHDGLRFPGCAPCAYGLLTDHISLAVMNVMKKPMLGFS